MRNSTTTTGSLIWNTVMIMTGGPKGSEEMLYTAAAQTLTNKTINGSQLVDDSVTNVKLDNSSVSFGGVSVAGFIRFNTFNWAMQDIKLLILVELLLIHNCWFN